MPGLKLKERRCVERYAPFYLVRRELGGFSFGYDGCASVELSNLDCAH
jgi:hypothetical protein